MNIHNRELTQRTQISDAQYVTIRVYHKDGRYCASVNREIHEPRDGYTSILTYPFDAVAVALDAGRYSDKRLRQYANAIFANMDALVAGYLALDMESRDEIKRRELATVYFLNPTAGIANK